MSLAPDFDTTIAALASPVGVAAIALIRMSGKDARHIFSLCSPKALSPRRPSLRTLKTSSGEILDHALCTFFPNPESFTGEDSIEICCHGGMLVTQRTLDLLIHNGAQPAAAGEFSQRAFLNGKMDLTQAEAVMDIINASSDAALKAAQAQLQGAIGKRITAQSKALLHLVAHTEAYIDFPEEDIAPDTNQLMLQQLEAIQSELSSLLDTADQGRILREGIRCVIIGAPNAGKSSLLNTLLGYDRAIVSHIEGTTRDTIEEKLNLGSLCLRLIDTAGLRESDDILEQAGMNRTELAHASADLLLHIVDASQARPELTWENATPRLLILNKTDLPRHPDWANTDGIEISCHNNTGIDKLSNAINTLFQNTQVPSQQGETIAINARHQSCLRGALEALKNAYTSMQSGNSPEWTALDLRQALDSLSDITGRIDTEDILGSIFSQFCIGK